MRKTNKIIAVVMTAAVLGMALTGCGEEKETKKIIGSSIDGQQSDGAENDKSDKSDLANVDEQVLYEENGIKITAKGMENDSIWGEGIKLLIENNTDKNVGVGCSALIVNNYMINDLFSESVAAGKKVNKVMYMDSEELEAAGIENIGQIEVYFHFYDDESYETLWEAPCVTIQTSDYANMDTKPQDDGFELYNQGGIRIVGKYVSEDSFWGAAVLLYIENNSGTNISVDVENMSINGFMVSPIFSCDIYNGKMAIDDLSILSSDLEENNIETIEDIELQFNIYNPDTYDTIADSGVISFKAS